MNFDGVLLACLSPILIIVLGCTKMDNEFQHDKEITKCFRSFDKFTFSGIDEINCNANDYPYVAITEIKAEEKLILKVWISKDLDFMTTYQREGEVYVEKENNFYQDEPIPYSTRVSFFFNGEEFSYLYFYEQDPKNSQSKPILVEFYQANPQKKLVYEFAVFQEERRVKLDKEISFSASKPHLQESLKIKAIGRKKITYTINKDRLIVSEVYHNLTESDEAVETKEIYSLEKYPAFYKDYISHLMFVEEFGIED